MSRQGKYHKGMTIQKDLSHLSTPRMTEERGPNVYARILIEEWAKLAQERGTLEHAVPGTSMRHSASGKCARQIHYYLAGTEVTNPFDLPAYWSTGLGTAVHGWWQDALKRAYPNAQVEVTCHIPEADSSGHVDAFVDGVSIELKSINGFGFKKIAEDNTGPRYSDFVQCCLNAYALKAERAVLIYLSLEAISRGRAEKRNIDELGRISKEFHFTPEIFNEVALKEIERWRNIREAGVNTPRAIPDPEIQKGARVADPSNGRLVVDGKTTGYAWMCNYCAYQDKCASDCADEVLAADALVID